MNKPTRIARQWQSMHNWRGIRPFQRHSLVLVVAGLVYVGIGISLIFSTPTLSRITSLEYALAWMPLYSWGMIFVFAGCLAILSARWPPISKTWGYIVLTALSAGWSGFYLVSIVFGNSPWINITYALVWGLIAFLWWAITGLMNPGDASNNGDRPL